MLLHAFTYVHVLSAPPLGLDAFMTFPNRVSLVASAKSLAWVTTTAGVTNLFGLDLADKTNKVYQITNNTEDAAMAFTTLQFVDDDRLIYTFGPDESSNPRHEVSPPGYNIFVSHCSAAATPVAVAPHILLPASPKRKDGSQGALYALVQSI